MKRSFAVKGDEQTASYLDTPTARSLMDGMPSISDFGNTRVSASDAAAAKIASRINASETTDDELNRLLRDRSALLEKKLSGQMSRQEEHRLALVRWSLDRVEDAKFGAGLDALEASVVRYEKFLDEVASYRKSLERFKVRPRKGQKNDVTAS